MAGGRRRWDPRFFAASFWVIGDLGVTLAAGVISVWADQSGNGFDLSQGTGADRPGFLSNGIGGRGAATFDGVQQFMDHNPGFSQARPDTILIVGTTAQDANRDFCDAPGSANRQIVGGAAPNLFAMFAGSAISAVKDLSVPRALMACFDGASSEGFADNSQVALMSGDTGTNGFATIRLGAIQGPLQFQQGRTGTFAVMPGHLDAVKRAMAFAWVAQYYGLSVS